MTLRLWVVLCLCLGIWAAVAIVDLNHRANGQVEAARQGCTYLGRILGTADVMVVQCEHKIELWRQR